jgi:mannose-6-phosphate isomerase-like protein (cupin superfamily)
MLMRKPRIWLAVLTIPVAMAGPVIAEKAETRPVQVILASFVEDFRNDPAAATPRVFGISVPGAKEPDWRIVVGGRKDASGKFEVGLENGRPSGEAVIFVTDAETLGKIDRGEMNALTAMGKARSSDPAPMDITLTPGFQPGEDFIADLLPFAFHFWTRGFPETVRFGTDAGREVHGATMVVLYYQKGLRSAWGQVRKGQRVNADPKDQVNPFPTLFIGLRGKALMRVGGVEKAVSAGQAVFVPPGTAHEAWNPFDEPAEFIILMFGDGA